MVHYVLTALIFLFYVSPLVLHSSAAPADKIPVLIVTGQNNHDWPYTSSALKDILEKTGKFAVDITTEPKKTLADAKVLKKYKAFVLDYNGGRWGEPAETNFLEAVKRGTGVAVIHAANNPFEGWTEYEKLVGYAWRKGTGHGKFHPFDVKITDRNHPVTKDLPDLKAHPDELYHNLQHMHGVEHRVLATAFSSKESGGTGKDEPMIIVLQYGKGRVFHTPLGHVWRNIDATRASLADPQLQLLIARGTEWAATGDATIKADQVKSAAPAANGGNAATAAAQANRSRPHELTEAEKKAGWKLLFDGKTTTGWRGFQKKAFPNQGWVVQDGCLKHEAKGGGGDIITTGQYDNFELELDWRIARGGNSGIMYRVSEDEPQTWHTGPEYQILDDDKHPDGKNPKTSAASVYGLIAPQNKVLRPVGEFNHTRIVVEGNHVEHWLNGKKVVEYNLNSDEFKKLVDASKFKNLSRFGRIAKGYIALQDHGDEVWYCHIKLRERPAR